LRCGLLAAAVAAGISALAPLAARAHPMGNFSVSRYAQIEAGPAELRIAYRVDQAEIPTLQELPRLDLDGDGALGAGERDDYLLRVVEELTRGQELRVNGRPVALEVVSSSLELRPGSADLLTLWIAIDYRAPLPRTTPGEPAEHRIEYRDGNYAGRAGWREIVAPDGGPRTVSDSSVPARDRSRGHSEYPVDPTLAPPQISQAQLTLRASASASAPAARADEPARRAPASDGFAQLIAARELSLGVVLFSIAAAFVLGGLHALSPGHGKTVVAAYLVGSRGTTRHALLLGAVVTATHTAGVFALGIVALCASQYVLPEQFYPWLGFVSGLTIVGIGAGQLVQRWQRSGSSARGPGATGRHDHAHDHSHDHRHDHDPAHGPGGHSHALPERITPRSLIALGVSGGLVPCPSALVVLLSAITLHRIGLGLVLIVAFSAGLAAVLTAVGLLVLYARRSIDRTGWGGGALLRQLPVLSAALITGLGAVIALQSLAGAQMPGAFDLAGWLPLAAGGALLSPGSARASVLGLGFVLGLQHALDVDHVAAVCAIVSENRSILRSSLIGAFWGLGHTLSLLLVGLAVIGLRLTIPEPLALALEFCVAIMLVGLGANALRKSGRLELHAHAHEHGHGRQPAHGHAHLHVHVAGRDHHERPQRLQHARRPLLIGMVHGLAGSAALMLLVLSTIPSPWQGIAYIALFGVGSIGGMGLMSSVIGLPFAFTPARFTRVHRTLAVGAGLFSLGFGLFLAWQIGFVEGLIF
jgi:ABC-type nickel/cobalt efflux system permease component RcnA